MPLPRLGVVGRGGGGLRNHGFLRRCAAGAEYGVGAVDLLRVEPQVPVVRALHQCVILPVVPPHQQLVPGGQQDFPWTALPPPLLLSTVSRAFSTPSRALAARFPEKAAVCQFPADVEEVLFRLPAGQFLRHAVQIVQIPPGNLHLFRQNCLRRLRLRVPLVVLRGVLLGRQKRVQRDSDRLPRFAVEVFALQRPRPPLHAVQVRGDEVALQP